MTRLTVSSLMMLFAAGFVASSAASPAGEPELEEIIVYGTFRGDSLQEVSGSISLLSEDTIRQRAARHAEQLLNAAPNVNYAAGASRGRYVQIRGVGERSQFVDPLDPSVGLVIDGIDLSGIGNAATLFDIDQVEIFRGPQGTRFGASALGGLLVMHSHEPSASFSGQIEAGLGNLGDEDLGAVVSGPLGPGLLGRVALSRHRDDGYVNNTTLGRTDTNARDELTLRTRLRAQPVDGLTVEVVWLHLDIDNGYDAFSLDNTRNSLADQPGQDKQQTDAGALHLLRDLGAFKVEATLTAEHSDLDYGYDEDWSYDGLCIGLPCAGWEYSSTDRYLRDRDALGAELRLTGRVDPDREWTVGVHAYRLDVALVRQFFDFAVWAPATFSSDYRSVRLAAYADLSWQPGDNLRLGAGLRVEQANGAYRDSLAVVANPDNLMWGGQLSARYAVADATDLYLQISRGYKAGGVNGEAVGKATLGGFSPDIVDFLRQRIEFAAESLVNYEAGAITASADGSIQLRAALFYMARNGMQNRAWYNDGPAFVGYLDNASGGHNLGAELEASWRLNAALTFTAAAGWLDTELGHYLANDPDRGLIDKGGRDQAHAPNYQFSLAGLLTLPGGLYGRLECEGRDAFYFSDSHDARSDAYALWHVTAGYRWSALDLSIWGRNLGDEDYAVRGFRFGNDPRDFYAVNTYRQWAAPRTFGVTARYSF